MSVSCSSICVLMEVISASDCSICSSFSICSCSSFVGSCCVGGVCGALGGLLGVVGGMLVVALAAVGVELELLLTLFVVGGHACGCNGGLFSVWVSLGVIEIGVVGGLL